jgi:hypothetical protein
LTNIRHETVDPETNPVSNSLLRGQLPILDWCCGSGFDRVATAANGEQQQRDSQLAKQSYKGKKFRRS